MTARIKKTHQVVSTDEEVCLVPYSFVVNGTSDADGLDGDELVSAAFSEAGEYLLTFRSKYAKVLAAPPPNIHNSADDVDLYAKIDTSTLVSAQTATVRCMTGATQTTPTDNTVVSGFLIVKKSTRRARGATR